MIGDHGRIVTLVEVGKDTVVVDTVVDKGGIQCIPVAWEEEEGTSMVHWEEAFVVVIDAAAAAVVVGVVVIDQSMQRRNLNTESHPLRIADEFETSLICAEISPVSSTKLIMISAM